MRQLQLTHVEHNPAGLNTWARGATTKIRLKHWREVLIKNWRIIREILLKLEIANTANTALNAKDLSAFAEQEVAYNMRLLSDAGYIKAKILESSTGDGHISVALARSLTNSGHELLDTIRNDTVWGKVQDIFKTKGIEMTFDLVIAIGKKVMEGILFS